LQHRYAAVDAQERQEAARAEREHQILLEQRQADDIALSIRMAEERGELVTMQQRLHGVGRTCQEAIEYFSALQDIEDAKAAARRAKKLRELDLDESHAWSGDVTAMTPEEKAADGELLATGRAVQSRRRELRGLKDDILNTVWDRWISPKGGRR
jgi:hypothetical protein